MEIKGNEEELKQVKEQFDKTFDHFKKRITDDNKKEDNSEKFESEEEQKIYDLIKDSGIEGLNQLEPDYFEPNSIKFKMVKNAVWEVFNNYEKKFASKELMENLTGIPLLQHSRKIMIDQYGLFKKIVRTKQSELADLIAHFDKNLGAGSSKQDAINDARTIKYEISTKFHHREFYPRNELGKR